VLDKEALGLRYQSLTDRRQSLVNVYGEVKVLAELGQHPNILPLQVRVHGLRGRSWDRSS
jgi:hypothetical protein